MGTIGFLSTNKLMTSPHAYEILREYNDILQRDGKVNRLKFYRENILSRIPDYDQNSWYGFLRRAYRRIGSSKLPIPVPDAQQLENGQALDELHKTMISNEQATQKGIQHALNLGASFFEELWRKYQNNEELSGFEQGVLRDALFKAMKAQDSRIQAIGKIREDSREEEKFNRAFKNAAFE